MMEFNKKQIQETNAFSCLECGKCTGVCPVSRYSQTFSPRQTLIRSMRNSHPDALKTADIWSCLTCQQCDTICPSDIKYAEFTHLIRQFVGIENRQGTCSHGGIMESILKIMTTPGLKQQRLDWLSKAYQTSTNSEYLYFMGCLPYYEVLFEEIDVHPLNIARSTLKILNYFDIKPQILSDEKCCGHDFYWNGDIENFKKLVSANSDQLIKAGVKYIITACAECYRTLKLDYPKFGEKQPFEVMHISEFLNKKFEENKIHLKSDPLMLSFHDPCRLGRHMEVYEPPRKVLERLEGSTLNEMAHHHRRSICCGVTGWMNCSQISKQIQVSRLREAKVTGADTLVTACPKCQIHFNCAVQDRNLKDEISFTIQDMTEVIARYLN